MELTSQTNPTAPIEMPARPGRATAVVKWVSMAVIVVGIVAIVRLFPFAGGVDRLRSWVDGLGFAGMAIFGLAYILAALLFVPGGALTMASGSLISEREVARRNATRCVPTLSCVVARMGVITPSPVAGRAVRTGGGFIVGAGVAELPQAAAMATNKAAKAAKARPDGVRSTTDVVNPTVPPNRRRK